MQKQKIVWTIALFLLPSLACGLLQSGGGTPPTEVLVIPEANVSAEAPGEGEAPVNSTSAGSEATSGGQSDGVPGTLNLDDPTFYAEPAGVDYRVKLDYGIVAIEADGTVVTGRIIGDGARAVGPPEAMRVLFTTEGSADFGGSLQMFNSTQIGPTRYDLFSDGTCSVFNAPFIDPYTILLGTGESLRGEAPLAKPGETVNGVLADGYRIDDTNIESTDEISPDVREVEEGYIYVAREGGYVVRFDVRGRGASEILTGNPNLDGDINYVLDFLDFGQPNAISPLEGCSESDASEVAYPMLDDASDLSTFPSMIVYNTQYTFEEALAFYQTEMPAAGWTATQEIVTAPTTAIPAMAMLAYTNSAGDTVNINIVPDPTEGTIQISILEPPDQ